MESGELRQKLALSHRSAFGWAMVCCGRDQDLAADVLQLTYCRILSGRARYAGTSEFSTWLFGVIRNVAREQFRLQKRLAQQIVESEIPQCASAEPLGTSIEHHELAAQLCSALEQLSQRQREVLHLTFYEDMTIEQAAQSLDVSTGTARQHYQRGKAALHRILETRWELEQ